MSNTYSDYGLGPARHRKSHPNAEHASQERYAQLSPNRRAFGHAGAGGSVGMADPDAKIGFGFTMNNFQGGIVSAGSTPRLLIDAFYETLR